MPDWLNNGDIFSNERFVNDVYNSQKGQSLPKFQPYYVMKIRKENLETANGEPVVPAEPEERKKDDVEILKKQKKLYLKDHPEAGLTQDRLSLNDITDAKIIKLMDNLDKADVSEEDKMKTNEELKKLGYELDTQNEGNEHIRFVRNMNTNENLGVLRGTNIKVFSQVMNTLSNMVENGFSNEMMENVSNSRYLARRLGDDAAADLKMFSGKDFRGDKMYKEIDRLAKNANVDRVTGYSKGGGLALLLGKGLDVPVHAINPLLGRQHVKEMGLGDNKNGVKITRTNTDPASVAIEGKKYVGGLWDNIEFQSLAPLESKMKGRNSMAQMFGEHALENFTETGPRVRQVKRNDKFKDAASQQDRLLMYKEMDKMDKIEL